VYIGYSGSELGPLVCFHLSSAKAAVSTS